MQIQTSPPTTPEPLRPPSVALISLGCAKNQVDSETILSRFLERGFAMNRDPGHADLAIVNTCGFIGPAKEESIETILDVIELKKQRPGLKIMVAGCLYQRYPEMEKELSEVDYWLTQPGDLQAEQTVLTVMDEMGMDRFRLPGEPEMYRRQVLLSEPGTAFVRISQGCDRTCAFCAIPKIKGGLVSRNLESLVNEITILSTRFGVKEISLVAQDLTNYGTDEGRNQFLELMERLDEIKTVRWFRLHYIYPFGLTRRMLEFLGSSKRFAPYLDMPFQHGDDEMLKVMRRGGSFSGNLKHIEEVRSAIPNVAMRTTMLVGHPRETKRRFENLISFIDEARFEWLGIFPFSPEEGTRSYELGGRVSRAASNTRVDEALSAYREARRTEVFGIGSAKDALVVEIDEETGEALLRSGTEAAEVDGVIRAPLVDGVKAGDLVRVHVLDDDDLDFTGSIVMNS